MPQDLTFEEAWNILDVASSRALLSREHHISVQLALAKFQAAMMVWAEAEAQAKAPTVTTGRGKKP